MAESIPLTDYKDLGRLYTKIKQNRRPARSNLRRINALDTETYKGNVFLIADSAGRFLDDIDITRVLEFLFHKKYQGAWNFFYNIEYDAGSILKLLPKRTLNKYKEKRELRFKYKNYKIHYIPKKSLSIRKKHHSVVFYDIAQFYHAKLEKAYQENIRKLPKDYLMMKDKRAEFSPSYYAHNKKVVRKYCIDDCVYTKELAHHWVALYRKASGFYPMRWISSGYLAEKVLINKKISVPFFASIPYEIQKTAYRASFGGRFEMLKRGHVGTGYLYDINSAYPYALANFPDLSGGRWIRSRKIHPKARLGCFLVRASIPDTEYLPPFPFKANNLVIFPTGKFETYVTLEELRACKNPKWYKIMDSYQFVTESESYPFRDFIETMYKKRLELKRRNDPLQLPIKIILNSIYGKTGQKIKGRIIGNLFNPVIFSFVTGFTRAQLYRYVTENTLERHVVAFATDSICLTKKLDRKSVV